MIILGENVVKSVEKIANLAKETILNQFQVQNLSTSILIKSQHSIWKLHKLEYV